MSFVPGICNFCGTGCGHLLDVEDNHIRGVCSSLNHPVSKGRLCARGWNIHELLNTRSRIKNPLIKKQNKFEKATYDEAVEFLLNNLFKSVNKNASNEIAFLASPRSSNEENYLFMKLARAVFRTNNISLDSASGHRNCLDVMHEGTGMAGMSGSLEEISAADFIMIMGIDIAKLNPIIGSEIHKAGIAGAELVNIDSRNTQIAKLSDLFIQIKPGSNKILLAALAKIIIEEALYDENYIRKFVKGYDRYLNVIKMLDYDDVFDETGMEPERIRPVARRLAEADSAMIFFPSGISGFDRDTISHIFNLFLLCGKIGRPGCGVNPITGISNLQGGFDMGIGPDLLTGYQRINDSQAVSKFNKAWNTDLATWPGNTIGEIYASDRYNIKILVIADHDEGIVLFPEKLEQTGFIAYIGAYENDFIKYADVVLPVATYAETDGTFTNTERRIQLSEKKIDPPYDVFPAWKLYARIAEMAGMKWNYSCPSDVMEEIARLTPAYSEIHYDKLRNSFGIQWPCNKQFPDGTERLNIKDIEDHLKFVIVPGEFKSPEISEEYPYLLMIGKSQDYWHKNNLMKKTFIPMREYNADLLLFPGGYAQISPEDAEELKLRRHSPVKIISPYGSMEALAMITDDIKRGTVYVPYFVHDMIPKFYLEHKELIRFGEDAAIPVRIAKV